MKKVLALLLAVCLLTLPACTGNNNQREIDTTTIPPIIHEYPGDTGISLAEASTVIPSEVYTQTGEENGLEGTLYVVSGTVVECNENEASPYFIVRTNQGDVLISDVSMLSVQYGNADYAFEFDSERLADFFPMPKEGEYVYVTAEYKGMSGAKDLPTFVYGSTDYLKAALMLSLSTIDDETIPSTDAQTVPTEKGTMDNPYNSGMYKVGSDLPAGEYMFMSTGSRRAYVCVSSDSNQDDILENESFFGSYFLTVADGQYLEINRGSFVEASNGIVSINSDGSFGDGMYRVGIDIPAGEYKIAANDSERGYWCIYNDTNIPLDIEDNSIFEGSSYVTVHEGQYLVINRCTAATA